MARRIIVTRKLPKEAHDAVYSLKNVEILHHDSEVPIPREQLLEWAGRGVDGIYCLLTDKIDGEVMEACGPNLKVVSTMSVGYNHIDVDWARAHDVAVGYTPDALTETTADLAVGLLLATARRIPEASEAVKNGEWVTWKPMWLTGKDVWGSKVGIVGLGSIGQSIARRLAGFGCRIVYTGGSGPKPAAADPLGAEFRSLADLLAESDFVVISCALSAATRGLIGAAELSAMKRDAVLVNIARGEVVDQEALVTALRDGEIAAAGLDVTTPEPIPMDSPLLSMPQVVVLPHIGSASVRTRTLIATMAADNLGAGIDRSKLPHPVFQPEETSTASSSAAASSS